jgi:hypothetical protein
LEARDPFQLGSELGSATFWLLRSERLQRELLFDDLNQLRENPELIGRGDEETSVPELEVIFAYRDAKARFVALSELDANVIH